MPQRLISILCGLFLMFLVTNLHAQLDAEKFYYGFHAGASYSKISEISTTLIRPIFPVGSYSTSTASHVGFTAGTSVYYRFKKSKFAIQPSISYIDLGGQFTYEDIEDFQYKILFNYNYLSISPIVKFYLVHGVHLSVGPQLNLIIDQGRMTYISNMPELGPDLQIQQSLREVLKGNSIAAFSFGAGYDMPFGMSVEIEYLLGISDAIETLANGFYFIENKNTTSAIRATIAYHIPFYN